MAPPEEALSQGDWARVRDLIFDETEGECQTKLCCMGRRMSMRALNWQPDQNNECFSCFQLRNAVWQESTELKDISSTQ